MEKLIFPRVFGLSGPWLPAPTLTFDPRLKPPINVSTSSTSSYLKSTHYDHVYITFNGLQVTLTRWTYSCTCFKETALLFNVHLSYFVEFILCSTDKYMFKVNNKKIRLICWMCSKLKINTAWHSSGVFIIDFHHSQHISVSIYTVSTFNFEQVFVSKVWKASHDVLKTQKAIYLFRDKSWKAFFI